MDIWVEEIASEVTHDVTSADPHEYHDMIRLLDECAPGLMTVR